jgi:hypothetical protein
MKNIKWSFLNIIGLILLVVGICEGKNNNNLLMFLLLILSAVFNTSYIFINFKKTFRVVGKKNKQSV